MFTSHSTGFHRLLLLLCILISTVTPRLEDVLQLTNVRYTVTGYRLRVAGRRCHDDDDDDGGRPPRRHLYRHRALRLL